MMQLSKTFTVFMKVKNKYIIQAYKILGVVLKTKNLKKKGLDFQSAIFEVEHA